MYASKAASRPGRPPLARGRDSWGHALRLSREEREWEEILLHLPNNVRQLWDALRDTRQLWRVLHAYGGQDLRVPRQEPKRDSPLRRRLGLRCLRKLMTAFGGTRVYVPRCNALLGKLRQREIIEGFSRHTSHGLSSTAAVAALAQRHDMSDRRIWQILKKEASAPAAPSVAFSGSGGSYALRYKVAAVDDKGRQSLPSAAGEGADARHPSDWVQGNSAAVSWQAVEGATEYNIYREEAGYFGFIGISQSTTFSDQNYQADTADTPREDWNPFAENNNPGVVAFHQQRMVLAATPAAPQAFYMSRTGDFENFRKSRPLQDDDPVEYLIASGSIDAITWAASFGDLLLGTSGSEYKAGGGGDGAAITPNSVSITAQSYWGSAGLAPIIIGNSILHVQRHGGRVRDLFYSLEKDGYAGNDLSILAPHLFEGHSLKQWAYQQTPGSTIWIARDDGLLLAFTYMKEHDIWGWSRQITDGRVRSVTALSGRDSDVLLLVVERRIQGETRFFLERLAGQWRDDAPVSEAFFVDCGLTIRRENPSTLVDGLDHLEGRELSVLADGSPVEGCVARNGRIELPYPAKVVQAGLGFVSALSPLPLESDTQSGSTLGRNRSHGRCTLRLHRSVGGKYGPNRDELYDLPFLPERWGEAVAPFSGDVDCIPGGGQTSSATIWLVQDRPLPFRLAALVLDVDFGEK